MISTKPEERSMYSSPNPKIRPEKSALLLLSLWIPAVNPSKAHVKNAKLTFDVNSIALLFGERILEHPELISAFLPSNAAPKPGHSDSASQR